MRIYPAIAKNTRFGNINGYLVIEDFPKYLESSDDFSYKYDVGYPHGGVTWSSDKIDIKGLEYIDETPKRISKCIIMGFDTSHLDDTPEYWTRERVIEELRDWIKQVEKANNLALQEMEESIRKEERAYYLLLPEQIWFKTEDDVRTYVRFTNSKDVEHEVFKSYTFKPTETHNVHLKWYK